MKLPILCSLVLLLTGCIVLPYPASKKVSRNFTVASVRYNDAFVELETNYGTYSARRSDIIGNAAPFTSPDGVVYQETLVLHKQAESKIHSEAKAAIYFFPYKDNWDFSYSYLDTSILDPQTKHYTETIKSFNQKDRKWFIFPPTISNSYLTPITLFHPYVRNGGNCYLFFDKAQPTKFQVLILPTEELSEQKLGIKAVMWPEILKDVH
jgi:hypothetical protein